LRLKKTNDLVTAGVEREIPFDDEDETNSLKYNFYIIAPYVENYRYPLFAIEYEMDLYPVRFHLRDDLRQELKDKLGEWEGQLMAKSSDGKSQQWVKFVPTQILGLAFDVLKLTSNQP